MKPAEQWIANQKFLDRAIARGDTFVLSQVVKEINEVSGGLRQELDHLIKQGYHLSEDGQRMVR
jgi:hypothetical protein